MKTCLVKGGVALQFASKEKARETLSELDSWSPLDLPMKTCLVKGGVALQFASKEKARETLSEWPTSVFGKEESIHPPRGESGKTVGF